jgi:hypothetical protein
LDGLLVQLAREFVKGKSIREGCMKRKLFPVLLFVMIAAFMSCATSKPFNEWTPKEKAGWFLGTYNAEYDDYMLQAKSPNLTDAQKQVLRVKKEILTQVAPMLGAYAGYVEKGVIPPSELELQIMQLLNRLAEAATKK